jgi:hypothetical protein
MPERSRNEQLLSSKSHPMVAAMGLNLKARRNEVEGMVGVTH